MIAKDNCQGLRELLKKALNGVMRKGEEGQKMSPSVSMMTQETTSNGNLEQGINLKKMLFGFCHWGFEVTMAGVSNSSEAMGSSLGARGQDFR